MIKHQKHVWESKIIELRSIDSDYADKVKEAVT